MEQTRAKYTLRPDGKVDVVNSGAKNGKQKEAKGVAKLTAGSTKTSNNITQTSFFPVAQGVKHFVFRYI